MGNGAVAIVIVGQSVDMTGEKVYDVVLLDKQYNPAIYKFCKPDAIFSFVLNDKLKALNFDVECDRKNRNTYKLVESNGSFSRLTNKKAGVNAQPVVICSVYVNEYDRILSYVVVDSLGNVKNIKADEFYKLCHQYKRKFDASYVQNGIFKLKDDKIPYIAAYPNKQFVKIVAKSKVKNSIIDRTAKKNENADKANLQQNRSLMKKKNVTFDEKQNKQLKLAKKYGVDPLLISNPDLSDEQMKVLWVSKHNGIPSGYFADPNLPLENMKFFSNKLVNKNMFKECLGLITPEYNVDQLHELYMGICSGIDYKQYEDPKISAVDMNLKRMKLEDELFYKKNPTKKKVYSDGYFERVGEAEFNKIISKKNEKKQ